MEGHTAHSDVRRGSITIGKFELLPEAELPQPLRAWAQQQEQKLAPWRAVAQRCAQQLEPYTDVPQRMTPWQDKHWRNWTLRQIKQRLDADDNRRLYVEARGDRRRPIMVAARPREHRSTRRRATRAGPSSDDGPAPDPPLACGRLGVA